MIVNEDFKFRDDMKLPTVAIELLTGPYKGVILNYTTVFIKEQEDQTATVQFGYDLQNTGKHTEESLRADQKFEFHIGLVLNTLILEATDGTLDATDGKDPDGDRENYIEEPVEIRELQSKGFAVPS
jgi:hypothetical protein